MESYTPFIIDAIAIGIIVFYIILSAGKGFVRTILTFIGYIVSTIISSMLSKQIATYLYDNYLEKFLVTYFSDKFSQILEGTGGVETLIKSTPLGLLEQVGIDLSQFETGLEAISSGSVGSFAQSTTDLLVAPWAMTILSSILFLLIFSVSSILINIFIRMFDGIKYIPALGSLNSILGGTVGFFQGIVMVWLISLICSVFIMFSPGNEYMNVHIINQTTIFKNFYNFHL